MIITLLFALIMLYLSPNILSHSLMHIILLLVAGLMIYHFKTQNIMHKLRDEQSTWTSALLRLWNEISTVILFAIVFLVIFRSAIDWLYGVGGLIGLAILLMVLIKLYKKYRKSKGEKVD